MRNMGKHRLKTYEKDIGMKKSKIYANIERFNQLINKSFDIMQTKAENMLNPLRYPLSDAAKKRLKWMYIIHYDCNGKIAKAARRIGISRQWISYLHGTWMNSGKDPRSLEPESRAPDNTGNRKRISKEIEDKIIEVRKEHHIGKDKLVTILDRDHKIIVGATTINRYLDKHGLLDVKISNRLKAAHKNKIEQKQKCRPPKEIKDYKPGALVEKDMKYIVKMGAFRNTAKYKARENFWHQHTVIDSFTRIRTIGLAEDGESRTAVAVQTECEKRFPFPIACANTDNGSENEKDFDGYLTENKIVHFYSRSGTPTDNPRVERSHLTDDVEFYQHENICKTFEEQKKKIADWEYKYNYVRPHQALGNLTPIEFYGLWKESPDEAYRIAEKWKTYLKKQRERLANSKKMKNKEKIAKLMEQIDKRLANNYK
jgi:transposase InsO family protein